MEYTPQTFITKTGLQIIVRSPSKSDAKELLDLIISLTGQTHFLLSTPEDMKELSVEDEETFIENNVNSEGFFVVVEANGKLIGDCNVSLNRHIRDSHRCSIGIALDEQYCNQGIGSILFDEMIKFALDKGLEQMELNVYSDNYRAIHLYQNKGFRICGTVINALKIDDGVYCDEHHMIKFLKG